VPCPFDDDSIKITVVENDRAGEFLTSMNPLVAPIATIINRLVKASNFSRGKTTRSISEGLVEIARTTRQIKF
jgi:hypothetical protein